MKVIAVQSQDLEDFYGSHDDAYMCALIKELRMAEPQDLEVFCLTSVYQLCLLNQPKYDSTKYLTIDSDRKGTFAIECLLPEEHRPNTWTHYRKFGANDIDQALDLIREGMKTSEGWFF